MQLYISVFIKEIYVILQIINYVIIFVLPVLYLSQMLNLIISIFTRYKKYPTCDNLHTFGYIICAKDEEEVIDKLIKSIYAQNYPAELMHVFVICDNCTDNTLKISKELGANIIERNNLDFVGKGYALDYGIKEILKDYNNLEIDAYFIFDADNLLTADYTLKMNNLLAANIKVATSYRNSQNLSKNFFSANSAFLFLRECEIIHKARSRLGIGTYVSGTGFYVSKEVLEELGGWPFYTLIEDIEFSLYCANNKIKIGYAYDAIFYDEQTESYKDSFNQKIRWCKGNIECFKKGYKSLIKNFFKKRNISCFEMFTHTFPFPAITLLWSFLYVNILFILALINNYSFIEFYYSGFNSIVNYYFAITIACYIQVFYTIIKCHKKVKCKKIMLFIYSLAFPFYVIWLGLLLAISLFVKVKWKKIRHINNKTINDMEVS